jgi:DNA-binding beta-propeller fold protein YncE
MKIGHHQFALFFTFGLAFLVTSICAYGDYVYYSCYGYTENLIVKMDSIGNQSVFASFPTADVYPVGLAFDKKGNLYVANVKPDGSIIKIGPNGTQSIFASLSNPRGLAFDNEGNLYTSCWNGVIAKVDPSGNVSPFVSGLNHPLGLAFDNNGNLYVAQQDGGTIMKYDQNGYGSIFAQLGHYDDLAGIAFDKSGNLYVTRGCNYGGIVKIDTQGVQSTMISGLTWPWGLAVDNGGNVWSASGGSSLLKIDNAGEWTFFSAMGQTTGVAVQIPEPATLLLLGLGGLLLRKLSLQ